MRKTIQTAGDYLRQFLLENRSTGQTVIKNSIWLLLAEGINKGVLFLVWILIARNYRPEVYGIFGYVFSVMTLIAMVADFGLTNATIRELAKHHGETKSYFEKALALKFLLSVLAFLMMLAAAVFMSADIRNLAMLAGAAILLEGLTDYVRVSFRVSEHSQNEVVIKAVTALFLIVVVAGCILLKLPLAAILLGFCFANAFGLLLSLRLIGWKLPCRIDGIFSGQLLAQSWPLFLGLIFTATYGQIDLILIKAYRGFAEVGLYQAGYKLLFGFQLLKVVHMAMFPRLAAFHAAGDTAAYRLLVRPSILVSLLALIPIGIAVTAFPSDILMFFFGPQYVGAATALPLLIWSGILSFIAGFFTYTMIIAGHQKSWLLLEFGALAVLIAIEVLLIPARGFYGAAVATLAGEVLFLLLAVFLAYSNKMLRAVFF